MPGGKSTAINELLEACEATPEGNCFQRACLVLRWDGRGFHLDRFFPFWDTNRQDADSASSLGSNTYRPAQNLIPDERLDFGQVSFGFEFTPAGFVCWVNHRSVLSTDKW